MPDDSHVGVHVAVDAVLHAGVLVALERASGHATSDALLKADGVELVDGCDDILACMLEREGASHLCAEE
jgi:hypothetical protein